MILLLGLTLPLALQLPRLTVDTSNASMAGTRPTVDSNAVMSSLPAQSLLIAVTADTPFSPAQWRAMSEFVGAVKKTDGVRGVWLPFIKGDGSLMNTLIRFVPSARQLASMLQLLRSEDDCTLGMLVMLSPEVGSDHKRTELLACLRHLLANWPVPASRACLVGLPVVEEEVGQLIQRDQGLLLPLSGGVLLLMLWLIYRDKLGVLVPVAVIGMAVVWTLGIYAWRVQQLNVVTSLLAPVVMILSLATAIHVVEAFWSCQREPRTRHAAVKAALAIVWRPCLFSALTTAAGLGALTLSSIPAVRLFGQYSALGVMLSFVFGISIAPYLCSLTWFTRHRCARTRRSVPWMIGCLKGCYRLGWYRRKTVLVVVCGISLLAVLGLTGLHSNTNLIDYLHQDSDLVKTSRLVDDHLVGVNTLDCRIQCETQRPNEAEQAAFLLGIAQMTPVNGVMPGPFNEDQGIWPMTLRVRAIGSYKARVLLADLEALARQQFGAETQIGFGGDFYRMVTDSDQLVRDLVRSFALALTVIMLLIGLQLRSVYITLIAMIPNLLSVLWIFGVMGWLGIDLSTGTAMIACVVLGLAVDHTIHYLAFLRHTKQRLSGRAIWQTTGRIGPALIISTLTLAAGFGVGIAGSFKPTIYFSLFTALAMVTSLFCNLIVIPALLRCKPDILEEAVDSCK